jgi:nucleotide-binding universal stress UspA family protein
MSSTDPFIIVVGIDFSELSGLALDQALEMATHHDRAEVHAIYVQADSWSGPTLTRSHHAAMDATTALQHVQLNVAEHLKKMPVPLTKGQSRRVVAHFRDGSPADNVAQLAADLDADLVVVGSHGHRGVQRFLLGSVAERISRLARCPVWLVRPKAHSTADSVPEIEPTCPDCLATRRESGGAQMWCARHSEHHLHPHHYSYVNDAMYSPETHAYASTP